MNDLKKINAASLVKLSDICRTCLVHNENMKYLLNEDQESVTVISMLQAVTNLQFEYEEVLPSYICSQCHEKLQSAYDFKQLCIRSHEVIKQCIITHSDDVMNLNEPLEINISQDFELGNNIRESNECYVDNEINEEQNDGPGQEKSKSYEEDNGLENAKNHEIYINEVESIGEDCSQIENKATRKQTFRLTHFAIEEVNQAIKDICKTVYNTTCKYCGFKATSLKYLVLHVSSIHKNVKDKWCSYCNEEFFDLISHKKTHATDFRCCFCDKTFKNKAKLIVHLKGHSDSRPFRCKICNKTFISAWFLKSHMKSHRDEVDEVSTTEKCIQKENSQSKRCPAEECKLYKEGITSDKALEEVESNERKSHENLPQNFCKDCNKKVRSLQEHSTKVHCGFTEIKEDKRHSHLCSFCGKILTSLKQLRNHLRLHTGTIPYKCSFCDKRCNSRSNLKSHERIHTGEKPYVCSICDKGFSQASVLQTHRQLHIDARPEQCPVCGQRFVRKAILRQHLRKHTGERPHRCEECGRSFAQSSHLADHLRIHAAERPYPCPYCEKAFRQRSTLNTHMTIHLGQKPFKCSECSYACRQSYSLSRHMKQHASGSENFSCDTCNRTFSSVNLLKSHQSNVHKIFSIDSKEMID